MAKQTIRDRLIEALRNRGETVVTTARTTKYVVMTRRSGGFYFLGKSGALRRGRTATESRADEMLRDALLAGDDAKVSTLIDLPF